MTHAEPHVHLMAVFELGKPVCSALLVQTLQLLISPDETCHAPVTLLVRQLGICLDIIPNMSPGLHLFAEPQPLHVR